MRPERFELEACCGREPAAEILSLGLFRRRIGSEWCARRDSNSRPIAPEAIWNPSVYVESTVYIRSRPHFCGTIASN